MAEILEYSLLFKKSWVSSEVKDLINDFGCVCLETPMPIEAEAKELVSVDFADQDGVDAYEPEAIRLKPCEWKIKFGTLGDTTNDCIHKYNGLMAYLLGTDGTGTRLSIYSSYNKVGRQGCYVKSVGDADFYKDSGQEVLTFSVTFTVTDPLNLTTLSN